MRHDALWVLVIAATIAAPPAKADPATASDRAAIAACLKHVAERIVTPTGVTKPPPEKRPEAGSIDPESCIGTVAEPCQEQPGGGSTHGMTQCNRRELAVWDERLNRLYRATVGGGDKAAKAVQRAERAWLAWREAKCALPAIIEEGGSIAGPLESACLYRETARQALWLEQLELYPTSRDKQKGRP